MNGLIAALSVFRKFSWFALWEASATRTERHDRQRKAIHNEHQAWFEKERLRPGAALQGAAPEEFQTALTRVDRARAAALHAYFVEVDPGIARERKQVIAALEQHIEDLTSGLNALESFDEEYRKFAAAHGEWRPRPSTERFDVIRQALAEFKDLERRRSLPPIEVKYEPPSTNPVNVAVEIDV